MKAASDPLQSVPDSKALLGLSKPFSDFFNCYTKAINKSCFRTGSLFEGPFGRVEVDTEKYLLQLLLYIHLNPQHHGIVKDFEKYQHSSYGLLISDESTFLRRDEVLGWFGSKESFIQAHCSYRDEVRLKQLAGDDN